MRHTLRSCTAATLAAIAIFTTACGTSPLEPTAPPTPAARVADGRSNTGFVVAWGVQGQPPAQDGAHTGFVVAWGAKGDQPVEDGAHTGFVVAWGAKGEPAPEQPNH